MAPASGMIVAGVDGCKNGWVAVVCPLDDPAAASVAVFPSFGDIIRCGSAPAVIAVDMPIGLPDRCGPGGRGPEAALRPLLGARQSSVFAIPSRAAVYAADYRAACEAALASSDPPRKVSKQAFHLFPKIREIDALLCADPGLTARVFECHPEGSFRMMRGAPLATPKKVKSRPHPPGLAERRALLAGAGFAPTLFDSRPRGAGPDDVLDACAAAWTARRIARSEACRFAPGPGRDGRSLPVVIWA